MSDPVIRIDLLGKRYTLNHIGNGMPTARYRRFSDAILGTIQKPFRKSGESRRSESGPEEFWALKDISLEIRRGEVVGIVGRNGAGKSTLLKILSRITDPTAGTIEIEGRVASLLEVGTGFHPELTGRENIFLNGAILGMKRSEIRQNFDEIVAFAEIEKFLDTPVKHYSSGMYVRLAFAVAAHLESDILIVDEVLAVGDSAFQEKCMGKMREATRQQGRTVLFVSHNMGAIQSLCSRGIVLHQGRKLADSEVSIAAKAYYNLNSTQVMPGNLSHCARTGTGEARITSVHMEDECGVTQSHFRMGEPLVVVAKAYFPNEVNNPTFGVNIVTETGIRVADCRSAHYDFKIGPVLGVVEYRMRIDSIPLFPRRYSIEPWIADAGCLSDFDWVRSAQMFSVSSGPRFMNGASVTEHYGISFIATKWEARVLGTAKQEEKKGSQS